MPTTLTSPNGRGSVEVPDEQVDGFLAAGWTKTDTKSSTKRSTSKSDNDK